jgi:purine-nucleoside phosphorylase
MHENKLYDRIEAAATWLEARLTRRPRVALILGSGLGKLADDFQDAQSFPYKDIPEFPVSTVEGHAGQLVVGTIEGVEVVAMQGRFHYYEGWELEDVTLPVRVFKRLGCDTIFVTNSSGGINPDYRAGDLMLISDHINLTGVNPLRGHNDPRLGLRFPDMSAAYDRELRRLAIETARDLKQQLHIGVYAGVQGPSYETPAEISMLRRLGGDAVGMSTVPEVIVASHANLRVLGISCITNAAAGISDTPLNHEEVQENAKHSYLHFSTLLRTILRRMPA